MASAGEIVRFWRDAGPKFWWVKDETFDGRCRAFENEHHAAARRELAHWEHDAESALALLILLDQIPRNIYRGTARAFALDAAARTVCLDGLAAGVDRELRLIERVFFYLPLEHSESREHQEHCVALFGELVASAPPAQTELFDGFRKYALLHRDIIERFGQFPHRNALLGRKLARVDAEDVLAGRVHVVPQGAAVKVAGDVERRPAAGARVDYEVAGLRVPLEQVPDDVAGRGPLVAGDALVGVAVVL